MPHVFSLAKSNSSSIRNRKDDEGHPTTEILWKVDWKFETVDTVLSDTCISESKTLRELITRFFDNTWKLGPTRHLFTGTDVSIDHLDVFLVNYQQQQVPVSLDVTLREALRDQAILEYPTFHLRQRGEIVGPSSVSTPCGDVVEPSQVSV